MKMRLCRMVLSLCLFTFLLGIHEGKIALWRKNNPQPIKIFPYSVTALPQAEQQRLQKGIPIESMDQLQRLYEAYFS